MPCTTERSRMEDKQTLWQNARDEFDAAANAALVADAAFVAACSAAVYTGGGGGFTAAACVAAIGALAYALNQLELAQDKMGNAAEAYQLAMQHYSECLAKCKRPAA